jgi:hypothetical protein
MSDLFNVNINCDYEYYFDLYLKETENFDITIIPQHSFILTGIYGFAVTKSIFIKNIFTIISNIILKSIKQVKIKSKCTINNIINFKILKKIKIVTNSTITSKLNVIMKKKISINSGMSLYTGKDTILEAIDNYTLDEIDNYTLKQIELKFGEGLNLRIAKTIKILDKNTISGDLSAKLLKLYKLSEYDNLLLSEIDDKTLGELDGYII